MTKFMPQIIIDTEARTDPDWSLLPLTLEDRELNFHIAEEVITRLNVGARIERVQIGGYRNITEVSDSNPRPSVSFSVTIQPSLAIPADESITATGVVTYRNPLQAYDWKAGNIAAEIVRKIHYDLGTHAKDLEKRAERIRSLIPASSTVSIA